MTTTRTTTSERYRAYDVVVVPFPYSDRLAEKRRPALVISTAAASRFGMLWVAMITSAQNESWSCDVAIDDLRRAGLPAASVVRAVKIAAIEPARVVRRAGTLNGPTARKVGEQLRRFLAAGA
jgi:mRNA interferase MazF